LMTDPILIIDWWKTIVNWQIDDEKKVTLMAMMMKTVTVIDEVTKLIVN